VQPVRELMLSIDNVGCWSASNVCLSDASDGCARLQTSLSSVRCEEQCPTPGVCASDATISGTRMS